MALTSVAVVENAGLYYLTYAMVFLVIYFEFLMPEVSSADNEYLRHWTKAEVTLILLLPLAILAAQLLLVLLSIGHLQPNGLLSDLILFISLWFFPSFPILDSQEFSNYGADFDTVCRAVRRGYFIWKLFLTFLITAIGGTITFQFLQLNDQYEYVFPQQIPNLPPSPHTVSVNKNGERAVVDMSRGYLTYFLHNYTPSWMFFTVMFYLSHLHLAATFRCVLYYVLFLMNMIYRACKWVVV